MEITTAWLLRREDDARDAVYFLRHVAEKGVGELACPDELAHTLGDATLKTPDAAACPSRSPEKGSGDVEKKRSSATGLGVTLATVQVHRFGQQIL
jgi:hypothetical protein